jgi:hypothetical protein
MAENMLTLLRTTLSCFKPAANNTVLLRCQFSHNPLLHDKAPQDYIKKELIQLHVTHTEITVCCFCYSQKHTKHNSLF